MVTTRHSDDYTEHALASFFQHTVLEEPDRFILFDNNKTFGSRDALRNYPRVELVENDSPRSFAANVNSGISEARQTGVDLYFLNNDLIFAANWLAPLEDYNDSIVLPVSNVEFSYRAGPLHLTPTMDFDDYSGKELYFEKIAEAHCKNQFGFRPNFRPAYFCVKIPRPVYEEVGDFDVSFGPGGAEDIDYSMRSLLAGFQVGHVLNSFVLHFQGKSTWRGAEKPQETQKRNDTYIAAFCEKWGEDLTRLFLSSDQSPLQKSPRLASAFKKGDMKSVILALRNK